MTGWLSDDTIRRLADVVHQPELTSRRYELGELLGEGGMGSVYLADDHELDRQVALKVLKDTQVDPAATDRMLKEARIIARLEHPGIVPVHDIGRLADGRVYYVMKLVRGRRLDDYFDHASTINEKLRVFERICETVSFAHAHGVIHRDLKPQNIMVGAFGEVLVLDWGVAKLFASNNRDPDPAEQDSDSSVSASSRPTDSDIAEEDTVTRLTVNGTIIGTPAYMAPEQARGEIDRVDERSDVYALGAILYFLLTGKAPGGRTNPNDVHSFYLMTMPESPRKLNRGIPKRLNAICMKALAPVAGLRYQSPETMREDVGRFLSGDRVSAHRDGLLERAGYWAQRYRTPILLVLAYLLMRVLMFFYWNEN
jgi:serine/threonine protein kinase